jgi:hypothetical protein
MKQTNFCNILLLHPILSLSAFGLFFAFLLQLILNKGGNIMKKLSLSMAIFVLIAFSHSTGFTAQEHCNWVKSLHYDYGHSTLKSCTPGCMSLIFATGEVESKVFADIGDIRKKTSDAHKKQPAEDRNFDAWICFQGYYLGDDYPQTKKQFLVHSVEVKHISGFSGGVW